MMEKVHEIHEKNPQIPILVDGGVGETTLPLCIEAGATRAVMSSALFNTDTYAWLEKYT
ncbi:hypothetical protein H6768_06225 [Candidatus Peribacteria bacterium]|nr:hypothetical protein [Candidatus Peribacteria bacterium]